MTRVELGALAEDFVYYQLRRRGIDVYRPAYSKEAVDFVVLVGPRIWRCQVKACAVVPMEVRLRHTVYSAGQYKLKHFERGKVDAFFVVDLLNEQVFVIPDEIVGNRRAFKLSPSSWAWQFKDGYDLFSDE